MQRVKRRAPAEFDTAAPGRMSRLLGWLQTSPTLLVVSLLLLIVVAAGALYLFIVPRPDTAPTFSRATPAPTSAQAAPPAADRPLAPPADSSCVGAAAESVAPETLVLTQYQTTWTAGPQGVLLPGSDTGGSAGSCFTRTPEGALYSAGSFYIQVGALADPSERIALVQQRASHTGAYDQLMDQLSQNPKIAGAAATTSQLRVIGYRWVGYSPDTAQLELQFAWTNGTSGTVQMAAQLVWEGDWKVVVPSLNSPLYRPAPEQTVYTPWGPSA